MKLIVPVLLVTFGAASAIAQTPSPASSAAAATSASPAARTDVYHVHFAKAALGKAAEQGDSFKKQAPDAPMPGHFLTLRHMDGDSWDYVVVEHLGTKATIDAARPQQPPAQRNLGDWHTDTLCSGPAWSEFAKQMGVDDASKSSTSAYVASVYRPAPGQREALDKFLNEPPDRAVDTSSGNIVLQHLEGAAWTFFAIARYNSWQDFAKNETNSVAQMTKNEGGWFQLRNLVSFHTDTLCGRIAP